MASKYGEIYTEDELVHVVKLAVSYVIEEVGESQATNEILERFTDANIREVARSDIPRKFLAGEPLFVLRGQDKRALGAVRWYRDHQWPAAPKGHLDGIDEAVEMFEQYRRVARTKEPD